MISFSRPYGWFSTRIRRSSLTTSRSVLNDLLVDPQRRHAIGFEPQHQRQVLRRHRLPEDRRVFVGVGVALPADAARCSDGCPSGSTFFEPLNIMCSNRCANPVRPGLLVLRADVIPELGVHDRRRVILEQHDLQAVRAASSSCSRVSAGGPRRSAPARSRSSRRARPCASTALERPCQPDMAWECMSDNLDYGMILQRLEFGARGQPRAS